MLTLAPEASPVASKLESDAAAAQGVLEQIKGANFFLRTALDQVADGVLILQGENASGFGPRILFNNTPMASLVGADQFSPRRALQSRGEIKRDPGVEQHLRRFRGERRDLCARIES